MAVTVTHQTQTRAIHMQRASQKQWNRHEGVSFAHNVCSSFDQSEQIVEHRRIQQLPYTGSLYHRRIYATSDNKPLRGTDNDQLIGKAPTAKASRDRRCVRCRQADSTRLD
jgi:hypothetical protein